MYHILGSTLKVCYRWAVLAKCFNECVFSSHQDDAIMCSSCAILKFYGRDNRYLLRVCCRGGWQLCSQSLFWYLHHTTEVLQNHDRPWIYHHVDAETVGLIQGFVLSEAWRDFGWW